MQFGLHSQTNLCQYESMPSPIVLVCPTSSRGAFQHDLHGGQEAAISSIALIECRLLLSLVFWGAIMNPSRSQSYRSKSAKLWRYRYRCVLVAIEHCGSVIRPSVVAGDLLPPKSHILNGTRLLGCCLSAQS